GAGMECGRSVRRGRDGVEHQQEEIVLVRNRKQVARLVPEAPHQNALEVFGDLYRTFDEKSADALSAAVSALRRSRRGRLSEVRNPWAGRSTQASGWRSSGDSSARQPFTP